MDKIVVTRHEGLVDYLVAEGHIGPDTDVISHATPVQVQGRHVIGVLPLSLAALAASITEVPLRVPAALRGAELTEEQVREFLAGPLTRYEVRKV